MSVNRFTEEAIEKFSFENISVRDQFMFSQARHDMLLNMVPNTTLNEWLFAQTSIL